MRSRLEDLMATAERQLASRSYEAAIDTYRTALGENGAAEAGVEARLEAAQRAQDEARGIARPVEVRLPPPVTEIQISPGDAGEAGGAAYRARDEASGIARPVEVRLPPPVTEIQISPGDAAEAGGAAYRGQDEARGIVRPVEVPLPPPVTEIQVSPRPEPEPAPAAPQQPQKVIDERPIEPPSFSLLEPDVYTLESSPRDEYPLEVEKLSILDPTPLREEPDSTMARLLIAAAIFVGVVVWAILAK